MKHVRPQFSQSCVDCISVSFVQISHGVLHKPFISNLPEHITDMYRVSYPFQITNSYGLFRRLEIPLN